MFIVFVHVHVKPEYIDAFKAATADNAGNSVKEPGVARFDIVQQNDAPEQFVLVEVYRNESDNALHKETAHYKRWRDAVEPMMACPRKGVRYTNVLPDDSGWD